MFAGFWTCTELNSVVLNLQGHNTWGFFYFNMNWKRLLDRWRRKWGQSPSRTREALEERQKRNCPCIRWMLLSYHRTNTNAGWNGSIDIHVWARVNETLNDSSSREEEIYVGLIEWVGLGCRCFVGMLLSCDLHWYDCALYLLHVCMFHFCFCNGFEKVT